MVDVIREKNNCATTLEEVWLIKAELLLLLAFCDRYKV